jgi:hypothetical protein
VWSGREGGRGSAQRELGATLCWGPFAKLGGVHVGWGGQAWRVYAGCLDTWATCVWLPGSGVCAGAIVPLHSCAVVAGRAL